MKEKVFNVVSKVKNNPNLVKLICFAVVSAAVICVSLLASGATIAYKVSYEGTVIGQVENAEEYAAAKELAVSNISAENGASYLSEPKLIPTLSLKKRISTAEHISKGILEGTKTLKNSSVLTVNGDIIAAAENAADIQSVLDKKLSSYNVDTYECSSEFTDDVKILSTYYPVDGYTESDKLSEKVENLSVKTTVKETTDIKLSYSTITKRTSQYSVGYYTVTTKGSNGLKHKVDSVVYLNGVEVSRESLEDVVVTAPVNQVVTIGTAPAYGSNDGTLLMPLASYSFISSYFGETSGRSKPHKAVDFAAPRGTPIYAAEDGVVIESYYNNGGYGNMVTIDHGNGMKTRYAHNSQNLVKKGQKVTKGETIALVGTTGQSTGNHLHFEVMINGVCVNGLNYIAK